MTLFDAEPPAIPAAASPGPTSNPGERGARCRSCQAPVRWASNVRTNKPAPIDSEASDDGNIHLWEVRGRPLYAVLPTAEARDHARAAGTLLYTNHFQTCPHAGDWR